MISQFKEGYISDESFFLNTITKWDAIIIGDYEGGMALPYIKKFGIKKLWQPPFIQRLTLYSVDDATNNEVFELICKNYRWFHFNLDFQPENLHSKCIIKERKNYFLPLDNTFENMAQNFSKSVRKKLNQGTTLSINFSQNNIDFTRFFELYQKAYGALNPQIKTAHYKNLHQICNIAAKQGQILAVDVTFANETVAGLLFFIYKNKITYFLGAPNSKGRELNALSFALFEVMKKYQNSNYILDFEGSSIPSVAAFYASFGAELECFYEIKYRNLMKKSSSV